MRLPLLALLLLVAPLRAQDATRTGEQLLDDAILRPADFDQMCSHPPTVNIDVPLPLYGLLVRRQFNLSEKQASALLARRNDVVAALVRRLDTMDLTRHAAPKKKPANSAKGGLSVLSDTDQHCFSGALLNVVMRLNAVEALPAMLKVEAQLAAVIEAAAKDNSAPVPKLEMEGIEYPNSLRAFEQFQNGSGKYESKAVANAAEIIRQQDLLHCRIYQRELLSAMAKLLRDAHFQPLLDSAIEQTYGEALKKKAQSGELRAIKKPEDIPADSRSWIRWDPIYNLPAIPLRLHCEMLFTPELRAQIRGFVSQFLTEHPAK